MSRASLEKFLLKFEQDQIIAIAESLQFDILRVLTSQMETMNVVDLARIFYKLEANAILDIEMRVERFRYSVEKKTM